MERLATGCIFLGFVIVAADYVRIPWTGKLKKDDFPRKLAKNENIGLESSYQDMGGIVPPWGA